MPAAHVFYGLARQVRALVGVVHWAEPSRNETIQVTSIAGDLIRIMRESDQCAYEIDSPIQGRFCGRDDSVKPLGLELSERFLARRTVPIGFVHGIDSRKDHTGLQTHVRCLRT